MMSLVIYGTRVKWMGENLKCLGDRKMELILPYTITSMTTGLGEDIPHQLD